MLTRYQYLLTKLAEEASEVAQIALKTQQFGADEVCSNRPGTNTERVHKELIDLLAIVGMLNVEYDFGFNLKVDSRLASKIEEKQNKVDRYYRYSQDCGMVEDPYDYDGE